MKGIKDIVTLTTPVPVSATNAHSSLEATSILPDTTPPTRHADADARTDAHDNEDVSGPAANSNQHENTITLSLTE